MKIYSNEIVAGIRNFYGDLLHTHQFPDVKSYLTAIADHMWEGIKAKNHFLHHEISNYHPGFSGQSGGQLAKTALTIDDCKTTIACEYGFNSWQHLETSLGDTPCDLQFESAVNHLIHGDLEALKLQLDSDPDLVKSTSKYGHGASLLHYTASNGVELWRQQVPANLPEITIYLLNAGADIHATMKVYGGMYDTLALLTTSAHPFEAGIGKEMTELLQKAAKK